MVNTDSNKPITDHTIFPIIAIIIALISPFILIDCIARIIDAVPKPIQAYNSAVFSLYHDMQL